MRVPDYNVDAKEPPSQALGVYGEPLFIFMVWRGAEETKILFCWPRMTLLGDYFLQSIQLLMTQVRIKSLALY